MTRIILLNGPPRVGKNTAAAALTWPYSCSVIGFSHHLKRFVHCVYLGLAGAAMNPEYFDDVKGEPQDILGGKTWRDMYIHYSEHVIKPLHGKEWFGEQFVRAVERCGVATIVVPDSGFIEEAERVVREYGPDNVALFRIHRDGIDFTGDSRSYIDLQHVGVTGVDIQNITGDPTAMVLTLKSEIARRWPT